MPGTLRIKLQTLHHMFEPAESAYTVLLLLQKRINLGNICLPDPEAHKMTASQAFEEANVGYVAQYNLGHLPIQPSRMVVIVTCMDARLDPARILGLAEGDAIVIRNAGGRVAEEMRSLIMTQQLLGVREIVVIHHTDCGVTKFTNDVVHSRVHEALHQDISDMDFMTFSDIDASIKDDVSFLRKSPLVSTGTLINGYNYNVSTGQISLVVSITT